MDDGLLAVAHAMSGPRPAGPVVAAWAHGPAAYVVYAGRTTERVDEHRRAIVSHAFLLFARPAELAYRDLAALVSDLHWHAEGIVRGLDVAVAPAPVVEDVPIVASSTDAGSTTEDILGLGPLHAGVRIQVPPAWELATVTNALGSRRLEPDPVGIALNTDVAFRPDPATPWVVSCAGDVIEMPMRRVDSSIAGAPVRAKPPQQEAPPPAELPGNPEPQTPARMRDAEIERVIENAERKEGVLERFFRGRHGDLQEAIRRLHEVTLPRGASFSAATTAAWTYLFREIETYWAEATAPELAEWIRRLEMLSRIGGEQDPRLRSALSAATRAVTRALSKGK